MAIAVRHDGNGHARGAAVADPTIPPVHFDHEELVVRRGPRSGVYCIIAVHSTALGPGARRAAAVALPRGDRRSRATRCGSPRDDLQGRGRRASTSAAARA